MACICSTTSSVVIFAAAGKVDGGRIARSTKEYKSFVNSGDGGGLALVLK